MKKVSIPATRKFRKMLEFLYGRERKTVHA